jgi:hypothetical protein
MHIVLVFLTGMAVAILVAATEHRVAVIAAVVAAFILIDEVSSRGRGRERDAMVERLYGMVALLGIRVLEALSSVV